jgi:hypothetical protein
MQHLLQTYLQARGTETLVGLASTMSPRRVAMVRVRQHRKSSPLLALPQFAILDALLQANLSQLPQRRDLHPTRLVLRLLYLQSTLID